MIRFSQPLWLCLLALLPVLAWLFGRFRREPAFLYSSVQLVKAITSLTGSRSGRILSRLRWIALAFLIVALAHPQIPENQTFLPMSGVDTVIALGLSPKMISDEMDWDGRRLPRLGAVRHAIEEYLAWGARDRVGLVVFGNESLVASPLTTHHAFVLEKINQAGILPTASDFDLKSLLFASLNRLRLEAGSAKSIILLVDDAARLEARAAQEVIVAAGALKTTVHAIFVGGNREIPSPTPAQPNPGDGSSLLSNSSPLRRMVRETGGIIGRANQGNQLRALLKEIHERQAPQRTSLQSVTYREVADWAMVPGLFLFLLEIILTHTVWRKLP